MEELKEEPSYWRQRIHRYRVRFNTGMNCIHRRQGLFLPHMSLVLLCSISLPAEGSMISSPPADSNVTVAIPNVPWEVLCLKTKWFLLL